MEIQAKILTQSHWEKLFTTRVESHISELRTEAKNISSEFQLAAIHERCKKATLEQLRKELYNDGNNQNDNFTEAILSQQLFIAYQHVLWEVLADKTEYKKKCKNEYQRCFQTFRTERWNAISQNLVCNESKDLTPDLLRILERMLDRFDKNVSESEEGENLIRKTMREDFKLRLHEKMYDKIVSFNQKPVKSVTIQKSVLNARKACLVAAIIFVSILVVSGGLIYLHKMINPPGEKEDSELKPSSNLRSIIEATNGQVKQFYLKEFDDIISQQSKEQLLPPELTLEYHRKASIAASSTCLRAKILKPRFLPNSNLFLDNIFQEKFGAHAVIGIDFGTKYTRAAIYFDGRIQNIPHFDEMGEIYDTMSSYVSAQGDEWLVGQSAETRLKSSSKYVPVFYDMKGIIRELPPPARGLDTEFTLTFTPKDGNYVDLEDENKKYPVVIILSKLFGKIRENAEKFLGAPLEKSVITIPSDLETRRNVIQEAGTLAGFTKVELLDEYMSAGFAVEYMNNRNSVKKLLFIQLGARYWGISILHEGGDVTHVPLRNAGFHLNNNLATYSIMKFREGLEPADHSKFDEDSPLKKIRNRRAFESCEKAVVSLSTKNVTTIIVHDFYKGKDLSVNITCQEFEKRNKHEFDWLDEKINEVMKNAKLFKHQISHILFAGGHTKIPKVQEIVHNYFKDEKNLRYIMTESENVGAYGAAVKGAKLTTNEFNSDMESKQVANKVYFEEQI